MAKDAASLNLAELESLIEERRGHLDTLLRKREQLEKAIATIDGEMQELLTTGGRGRRVVRRRAKNQAPLRTVIIEILSKNKKGLSIRDLVERVTGTGYQSQSKNFQNVVSQCLYNTPDIMHDDSSGLYRLKR